MSEKPAQGADKVSTTGRHPVLRHARPTQWDRFTPFGKAGRFLLAAAVTALVSAGIGNWIANTYANRQRELALKASLITAISRGAIELYDSSRHVARFHGTAVRRDAMRERALSEWVIASSELDPTLFVYFDGEPPQAHWDAYQDAIYGYGQLACCAAKTERWAAIQRVRAYVGRYGPPDGRPLESHWDLLVRGPADADDVIAAYNVVGHYLMRGRGGLARDIQRGSADLG